jgi:voltage-gated potassium channel
MIFVRQGYQAVILVTLTLILQSAGMAALIQWIKAQFPNGIYRLGLLRSFLLVVRFTSLLVCLHMLEILLWASFYRWKCFATWEAAFYFSAANYSTVGAGDLFLKQMWRTMGPVESVTGALMCGLSASFLFAIVTRLVELEDPGLANRTLALLPTQAAEPASRLGRDNETVNIRDAVVAQTSGR